MTEKYSMKLDFMKISKKQVPPHHKVWFEQALVFRMLRNENSKFYYCTINGAVFISDIK